MWPYWLMFLVPAMFALGEKAKQSHPNRATSGRLWDGKSIIAVVVITFLVGFRYAVGGDWASYERLFSELAGRPLQEILLGSDPGYGFLNWFSAELGWDIFGVNLGCGLIFGIALFRFCRTLPRPWLAITTAVPYLLIVVAMGYSRQAVALSFAMIGLVSLRNRSTFRFVVWVLIGATFHKTAVLLLPIAALARSRNRYWSIAFGVATTYAGYLLVLQDSFDALYTNYVDANMASEGALVRLLMNALPSLLLLYWRGRIQITPEERSLWRWFALISLGLLVALFATSASTAIDRVALYMLPIQLMVFSHLPLVFSSRSRSNQRVPVLLVVGYYAVVLAVWLNFATNSTYWIPYRSYPFEEVYF
jgi:hypothetical protein